VSRPRRTRQPRACRAEGDEAVRHLPILGATAGSQDTDRRPVTGSSMSRCQQIVGRSACGDSVAAYPNDYPNFHYSPPGGQVT
jgi:hypothetical protein